MCSKIILPLEKEPPIITFNCHAAYLSILFTIKDFYKYFYSDFINIWLNPRSLASGFIMEKWYCNDEFFDMLMLTSDSERVITDCFGEDADEEVSKLLREENCIKSIKLMLRLGFYVSGRINEFYVPKRSAEGKWKYRHDFYLNGYDDIEQCFYLSGYTINQKYETITISYDKFVKGLRDLEGEYNVLSFCRLKDNYNFEFNINKIVMLLEDYINARSSFENPSGIFKKNLSAFYYGISVYDGLAKSIEVKKLDLRVFRMLLEHKKCMFKRLELLSEADIDISNEIKNGYSELVDLQSLAFNFAMKYEIRPSSKILEKILEINKYIKERERGILEEVILKIKEALK